MAGNRRRSGKTCRAAGKRRPLDMVAAVRFARRSVVVRRGWWVIFLRMAYEKAEGWVWHGCSLAVCGARGDVARDEVAE